MYGSFYTNICRFLSTLNGGIKHQRPTVKLPLSKVGLELSRILANLGIIHDFTIGQRLARVRSHSRLWDPTRTHINSSADASGFPAMYLTLHINWDKHKPIWSTTPLAAARYSPATASSSTRGSEASSPLLQWFTPPVSLNSPTPESIKILSKPSKQRWMGLQQLLSARKQSRPGIFLLSTHHGLLTDIDCELRGIGGTVLAHLGLPMGQVVQLRGLLRAKYLAELQAALPSGATPAAAAAAAASPEALQAAKLRAQHVPLAEWDARAQAVKGLSERVAAANEAGDQHLGTILNTLSSGGDQVLLGGGDEAVLTRHQAQELLQQAHKVLEQLEVQEAVWNQHGGKRTAGSSSSDSSRGAESSGFRSRNRESLGRRSRGVGRNRDVLGDSSQQQQQQQQQQQPVATADRWQPEAGGPGGSRE